MSKPESAKKLTKSIAAVVILALCLCITTLALVYSMAAVDQNIFQTGKISINLNDGKPVIQENEFLFEPGMTVEKKFFLKNQGTWDVYYKLYFDHVEGDLADTLDVSIRNGDKVLYSGKMTDLQENNISAAEDVLKRNERRELTIVFHYPEASGNEGEGRFLSFDFKADAVQTKNNLQKEFDKRRR